MEDKIWQKVKDGYLRQVEEAVAGHDRGREIVEDVARHLEEKYAALRDDERTWDNFQKIITDMGPAGEYGELLEKDPLRVASSGLRVKTAEDRRHKIIRIAIAVAVIVGIVVLALAVRDFAPGKTAEFVLDPEAVGRWESVDFVAAKENFQPGRILWQGGLYLKGLELFPNGTTAGPWSWTKGSLYHPGDKTTAHYEIHDMAGVRYMFFEWMSGDVTIRHQKPWYYVLKKIDTESAPPITMPMDQVLKARAMDLVKAMVEWRYEDVRNMFDPTMKAALSRDKLQDVWNQLEQAGGPFKEANPLGIRITKTGEYTIVYYPCKWEHNALDFKVVFDKEGKVSGLWTVAPGSN